MSNEHPVKDAPEKIKALMAAIIEIEEEKLKGKGVIVSDITALIRKAES